LEFPAILHQHAVDQPEERPHGSSRHAGGTGDGSGGADGVEGHLVLSGLGNVLIAGYAEPVNKGYRALRRDGAAAPSVSGCQAAAGTCARRAVATLGMDGDSMSASH